MIQLGEEVVVKTGSVDLLSLPSTTFRRSTKTDDSRREGRYVGSGGSETRLVRCLSFTTYETEDETTEG